MKGTVIGRNLVGASYALLVAGVIGAARVSGSITLANSALWFAACIVPPAITLMSWWAKPLIVAEAVHPLAGRD